MRNLLFFFLIALMPVAIGCTQSKIFIGGDDAAADTTTRRDGRVVENDGGPDGGPGIACGPNTCTGGDVCCNESCGTCAPPGAFCTQESCAVTCGPNTCTGGDVCCNESCGTCVAPGGVCTDQACAVVCGEEVCGDTQECCPGACPGDAPTCSQADGFCPDTACPGSVCGGVHCGHAAGCCAGCRAGEEYCAGTGGECPPIACPPPQCDAQDVRFDGDCEPAPRYWWNGEECTSGTGCDCIGADCGSTFTDQVSCEAAYSECTHSNGCDVDDAYGVGFCDAFFGYAWDGFSCTAISGCSCEGADCNNVSQDQADCEARHAGCAPPPTCESDTECGTQGYCDSCARGSCAACEDCVSGCRPHSCMGDGGPIIVEDPTQPECGPQGVAVPRNGHWECVVAQTCVRLNMTEM